jgi:hypothetical protein
MMVVLLRRPVSGFIKDILRGAKQHLIAERFGIEQFLQGVAKQVAPSERLLDEGIVMLLRM